MTELDSRSKRQSTHCSTDKTRHKSLEGTEQTHVDTVNGSKTSNRQHREHRASLQQVRLKQPRTRVQTLDLDADLTPFTATNSQQVPGLKAEHQTINLLENNTAENLGDLDAVMTFYTQHRRHNPREKSLLSWTALNGKLLLG